VSILDQANAAVVVYPQVLGRDPDGNPQWTPSTVGVEVPAMVWPLSADERAVNGQQAGESYRMRPKRGAACPAGPWAQVEWDGRRWDVEGEPVTYRRGRATGRTVVTLRTTNPKPEV
jgi:hypothetical protein